MALANSPPDGEAGQIGHLNLTLSSLDSRISEFAAALQLMQFCRDDRQRLHSERSRLPLENEGLSERRAELAQGMTLRGGWLVIATRDAAITLYHFRSNLYSVGATVKRCPTILPQIDMTKLKVITNDFETALPDVVEMRHAIGHAGDMRYSADNMRSHTIRDEKGGLLYAECAVVENTLVSTRRENGNKEATLISVPLDWNTHDFLRSMQSRLRDVFAQVKALG